MKEKLHDRAKQLLGHEFTGKEDGEEYGASSFGGFGEYLAHKIVKLQNQAKERIESENKTGSQIFRGCVIYITGYTRPSLMELKHLITLHGGVHCAYMSGKSYATHIVAASLTPRKREEYANYKVAKPEWIVDSIRAGKLLPWSDYRTIQPTSRQIPKFLNLMTSPPSSRKNTTALASEKKFVEAQSSQSAESPGQVPAPESPRQVPVPQEPRPATRLLSGINESDIFSDESDSDADLEKLDAVEGDLSGFLGEVDDEERQEAPLDDKEANHGDGESEVRPAHSKRERRIVNCLDPDFIKTFYENSRLHHLSTWKGGLKRKYQSIANKLNEQRKFTSSDHERVILHVDFDAFFVSVSLLRHPELADKPACVSYGGTGSGDIASCNYTARKFGVRNGMWMAQGLKLCPELKAVPYYFDDYERCSDALYSTLLELEPDLIYPVSVDEALVDISSSISETDEVQRVAHVEQVCDTIRNKIRQLTGVEVSVGAGPNVLVAKIAIAQAKPAGSRYIPAYAVNDALSDVRIASIPGVGHYTAKRLHEALGAETILDLRAVPKAKLQDLLGIKNGARIYDHSRGIDKTDISVVPGPKSVGVEICWGIRVSNQEEMDLFVANLCAELQSRMVRDELEGKLMSVKIYRRAAHAPIDPPKYLGCGECDTYSKSVQFSHATNELQLIVENAQTLVRGFGCPPLDFRGLGIQIKVAESSGSSATLRFQSRLTDTAQRGRKSESPVDSLGTNQSVPSAPRLPALQPAGGVSPSKRKTISLALPSKRQKKTAPVTLTQHFQRTYEASIDENVLNELPTQIREDIRSELQDMRGQSPTEVAPGAQPRTRVLLSKYTPVAFRGNTNVSVICDQLQEWVSATVDEGPHFDDMVLFDQYIRNVATNDLNWGKLVRIIEVLLVTLCSYSADLNKRHGLREWLYLANAWRGVVQDLLNKRLGYRVAIENCCSSHAFK